MLEDFTLETFSPLVGDEFILTADDPGAASLTVRLAAATAAGSPSRSTARAPFFLLFRGPAAPILPQRIHRLEHAGLGAFDLFLVPLEPDADGARYEAVFA